MDAILFSLKRAHQSSMRFQRRELDRFGLTPARFDLMFILRTYDEACGAMRQSALRRDLGVSRPTVSRMLTSLERLGFVRRTPRRHTRWVSLTGVGRYVIRRAAKHVLHSGLAFRTVTRAVRLRPKKFDFMTRDDLHCDLRAICRSFGDVANTLCYHWHPDD